MFGFSRSGFGRNRNGKANFKVTGAGRTKSGVVTEERETGDGGGEKKLGPEEQWKGRRGKKFSEVLGKRSD